MRRMIVLLSLLLTACTGDRITSAPPESAPVITATTTGSPASASELAKATDVRAVDWRNTRISARFCGVDGLVEIKDGEGTARSSLWGQVFFYVSSNAAYGDIDGDGKEEAAVNVGCSIEGSTAGSQRGFAYLVMTVRDGSLLLVGEVSAKSMKDDSWHVPLLDDPRFEKGAITVKESWYRPSDGLCCPTGKARTTWRLRDGVLVADPTVQIS